MDKDEADDNDDADDLDEALVAGGKACGKCVGCRDEAADKDMMASDETAALWASELTKASCETAAVASVRDDDDDAVNEDDSGAICSDTCDINASNSSGPVDISRVRSADTRAREATRGLSRCSCTALAMDGRCWLWFVSEMDEQVDWLMSASNCDGSVPRSTDRPRALRIDRAMMMHANEE
jgi:hypothetical protein